MCEPRTDLADGEKLDSDEPPTGSGFAVRLQETEGRRQSVALRCFRTPTSARLRDFTGRTTGQATIDNDVVRCELAPFEIADLELRFDQVGSTETANGGALAPWWQQITNRFSD